MKNKVIKLPLFDPLNESLKNRCIGVRKKIELKKDVITSRLKLYANCQFALYVNTQPVLRYLDISDKDTRKYEEVDITDFTRNGNNSICVMLYAGEEEPWLYIDGEIDTGEEKIKISADEEFKVKLIDAYKENAPKLVYFKNPVEIFDNRVYEDWLDCDFDDSRWKNASVNTDEETIRLERNNISFKEEEFEAKIVLGAGTGTEANDSLPVHLRIYEETKNVKMNHVFVVGANCEIKPLDKGSFSYLLIDFERVVSGFLKLDVTGYKDDIIDVCFAQKLENERPVINSVCQFVLKDDENILETRFYENTFRYVLLVFRNYVRKDVLNRVSAIQRTASFIKETENKDIFELLTVNVKDRITGGDKLFSLKEQYIYVENLYKEFGETTHFKNIILNMGLHQLSDGRFPANYPYYKRVYDKDSMLFVNMLEKYFEYTKDESLLDMLYNRILICLNYFMDKENKNGLLEEDNTVSLENNLCYIRMLESISRLAVFAKQKETASILNKKIKKLKKYIKKNFYNEKIKVYSSEIKEGVKNEIIDVDANILMLHMLHNKADKQTEIMMNNLTDRSIVTVDVKELSDDKLCEFVSVCKKLNRENLIKPELEKHSGDILDLTRSLMWKVDKNGRYIV